MWLAQFFLMLVGLGLVVAVVAVLLYFAREQIGEAPTKVCDDVEAFAKGCVGVKEDMAMSDPFCEIGGAYAVKGAKRRRGG